MPGDCKPPLGATVAAPAPSAAAALALAQPEDSVESGGSLPATASHRTRRAGGASPARQSHLAAHARKSAMDSPNGSRVTTALEFSLEDTPLAGSMTPPVWREPSPSCAQRSRQHSPARTASTAAVDPPGPEDSASSRSSNRYVDVEREATNQRRRHVVVRHFFASHEDAIRLYIRLQQLLSFRDLSEAEFRERLLALPSEEAKAAAALRSARPHGPEREISQLQAALAHVAAASPELAGALGGLRGVASPARSSAAAAALAVRRARQRTPNATTAQTQSDPAAAPPAVDAASPGGRRDSHSFSEPAQEPPNAGAAPRRRPSPQQPHMALAAWRSAQKSELPSAAEVGESTLRTTTESAGATKSSGFTPRDRTLASDLTATRSIPLVAAVTPQPDVQLASPAQPPLSSPRRERTARCTTPRGSPARAPVATPRSGQRDGSTWLHRATEAAPHDTAAAAGPSPTAAAVAVVPRQRRCVAPMRSTPLLESLPQHSTPPRAPVQSSNAAALTDSPLARYRAQRGYQDPTDHFHTQRTGTPRQTPAASPRADSKDAAPLATPRGTDASPNPRAPVAAAGRRTPAQARPARQQQPQPAAAEHAQSAASSSATAAKTSPALSRTSEVPTMGHTAEPPLPLHFPATLSELPHRRLHSPPRSAPATDALASAAVPPSSPQQHRSRSARATASPPLGSAASWSPVDPPMEASSAVSHLRHLRPSASVDRRHGSVRRTSAEAPQDAAVGETAPSAGVVSPTREAARGTPPEKSVWDEVAALERRVGGLEGRTAALEGSAARRAVLEALRLLKVRVAALEERTSALEHVSQDSPLHLSW
ncbi:hypothetical protein NESM_000220600 [Novymonas esmeraldas]|uniref:Uncharacterized protein n=1 Tax=Novymonas esmeraldas TaxID=1808958 RepID=A0AAW0F5L3_9TRYP